MKYVLILIVSLFILCSCATEKEPVYTAIVADNHTIKSNINQGDN